MIRVNVSITNVSAERYWKTRKPIPPIQINTNLNLVEVEKKEDDSLEVPFVLTVNYNPSVAQISVRGRAFVTGNKDEIARIHQGYKKKKPPPQIIMQTISNVVFIESQWRSLQAELAVLAQYPGLYDRSPGFDLYRLEALPSPEEAVSLLREQSRILSTLCR